MYYILMNKNEDTYGLFTSKEKAENFLYALKGKPDNISDNCYYYYTTKVHSGCHTYLEYVTEKWVIKDFEILT